MDDIHRVRRQKITHTHTVEEEYTAFDRQIMITVDCLHVVLNDLVGAIAAFVVSSSLRSSERWKSPRCHFSHLRLFVWLCCVVLLLNEKEKKRKEKKRAGKSKRSSLELNYLHRLGHVLCDLSNRSCME